MTASVCRPIWGGRVDEAEPARPPLLVIVLGFKTIFCLLLIFYNEFVEKWRQKCVFKHFTSKNFHTHDKPWSGPDHPWGWWGSSLRARAPIEAPDRPVRKNNSREKICSPVKFLPSGVSICPAVLPQYSLRNCKPNSVVRSSSCRYWFMFYCVCREAILHC